MAAKQFRTSAPSDQNSFSSHNASYHKAVCLQTHQALEMVLAVLDSLLDGRLWRFSVFRF